MKQRQILRRIYWISTSLAVVIVVFLGSVIFLHPSSVGNPRFVWMINFWAVFWALNFVIVLILSFILARSLIKLFFEYQAQRPGSRIKSKLVVTLVFFSLFPAFIMAFLAFGLINQNLRQWFSSPSEQLLRSSQLIAQNYYEQDRHFRLASARLLARRLEAEEPWEGVELLAAARRYGFQAVQTYGQDGSVLFQAGRWSFGEVSQSLVSQVLEGDDYYDIRKGIHLPEDPESIVDSGLVGVFVRAAPGSSSIALFVNYVIPESIAFHAIEVDIASKDYQAIKSGVRQLELNYFSVLGLTILAVVFGFVWLGTYIARQITVPLEALAEGARELAEGNLDHRVDVSAVDELGILVGSFNRMAQEIKQSRQKLEKANTELRATNVQFDERRRYIETILQNIATGVISIDEANVIRAVNEAALKMLHVTRENIMNRPIEEAADNSLYSEFLIMKKRAHLYGTYRKEVTFGGGNKLRHVAATITSNPLPFHGKVEYLIVLDDLTELIKAEKFAAWQEVARRLAHEIKNPLTPIQLCAERIQKRFETVSATHSSSPDLQEFRKLLGQSTRIIVTEAKMLKTLVEEFTRFARLPICKPVDVQLHRLIEQTLTLYDGGLERVRINKIFDPKIGSLKLDPEQMQRVFINLIDNSLDALAKSETPPHLLIRTRFNEGNDSVTIEFHDNGVGISPQDYEHLFLPYFSTKKKGTGLGLAIVRQIIIEHKGFVRAEPNHPVGTRFIMELPLGQSVSEESASATKVLPV